MNPSGIEPATFRFANGIIKSVFRLTHSCKVLGIAASIKFASLTALSSIAVSSLLLWIVRSVTVNLS
jgi:hypothetical protein